MLYFSDKYHYHVKSASIYYGVSEDREEIN